MDMESFKTFLFFAQDYALVTNGVDSITVSNLHSVTADYDINITEFGTVTAIGVFDSSVQRTEMGIYFPIFVHNMLLWY